MSYRRLGLLSIVGIALITVLVAALLLSGMSSDAGAAAPVAQDTSTWTYQGMSTDRSAENPYLGTPQQQWLVAGGLASALVAGALLRRRLRAA